MSEKPTTRKKNSRNTQGMGSIRKRSDGRWEGRYTVGIKPGTGEQDQRSVYGKTEEIVARKLRKIMNDLDEGTYAKPTALKTGDWFDSWLVQYNGNVKSSTLVSYGQHVKNHIKPAMGALKLTSIKTQHIQDLYKSMEMRGLSPKTIKNVHGVVGKGLNKAMELGYIKTNPAKVCVLPREEETEIFPLESHEIKPFLLAIVGHRYEHLFKVAIFTGMRIGELLGLTWDKINFARRKIKVNRQLLRPRVKGEGFRFGTLKNDKPRTITAAHWVMEVFEQQKRFQENQRIIAGELWNPTADYVFSSDTGGHASYWQINSHFQKILESINIQPRRFHELRHTYAVTFLRSGGNIKTLQHNLGHHSVAFTLDTYGHVTEEMHQESTEQMDAMIATLTS